MEQVIEAYRNPDFWLFNKETVALSLVVAIVTGLGFALAKGLGELLWDRIKRRL